MRLTPSDGPNRHKHGDDADEAARNDVNMRSQALVKPTLKDSHIAMTNLVH